MISSPGSKIWRVVDGFVLIALYRVLLKFGMYSVDEYQTILGENALYYLAPAFTILSIIIFGLAARLYFRYRP